MMELGLTMRVTLKWSMAAAAIPFSCGLQLTGGGAAWDLAWLVKKWVWPLLVQLYAS